LRRGRYLDLWRHVTDPGILSSQHHPDGMRPCGRRTIRAHGVAGGESLLQTASGYSNALWRISRLIERGRHSRRGRKRSASEIHEAGRDAKVLVRTRRYFFKIGMISVWIGCPVTSMSLSET